MSDIQKYKTTESQRRANAKWKAKNREKVLERSREYARKRRADDPEGVARVNAKSRAKHREKRYSETAEWRKLPETIEHVREYNRKRHQAAKKAIYDAKKDKPCMDCGQTFPPCAMDYHHRDPTTKSGPISFSWSEKRIRAEVAKCDLLCAVCHRIRHHAPV